MSDQPSPPFDLPKAPSPEQLPAWRTVSSSAGYAEAERTVERLSLLGYPVESVAIVGRDLRSIEQITGRTGYARSAGHGALSGALAGLVLGWFYGVLAWVDPLVAELLLACYGLLVGAVVGAVVGLASQALRQGRRDFTSVTTVAPQHFDVVVGAGVAGRADEARRLLSDTPVP